jgi:SET domain-containing protein
VPGAAAGEPPAELVLTIYRGQSAIAGTGLFPSTDVRAGTLVLAGARAGEPPINHSCDPNVGWSADGLVTMRDVAAGTELTTDYALSISDPAYLLRCHCQTYRCRQLVTGDDWRIPELQRRYFGHWAPAVQRLIDD